MPEFLELTVDKFTFQVATDRFYTREGVWVQASPLPPGEGPGLALSEAEGVRVRVGLADFLQQKSGDVAFAEVMPEDTRLAAGDEVAVIETIKVDVSIASPVAGTIVEINPGVADTAEIINQDPYGAGWLAVIAADDWETDRTRLLDGQAYFEVMKAEAETADK